MTSPRMSQLLRNTRHRGSNEWATPREVYDALHAEFDFTMDACPLAEDPTTVGMPLFRTDALTRSWKDHRVWCNPPYSNIGPWLAKASEAEVAVFLLPARTDTGWWHDHALKAAEIRWVRGRLKFGGAKVGAPFPSVVLVYMRSFVVVESETTWGTRPEKMLEMYREAERIARPPVDFVDLEEFPTLNGQAPAQSLLMVNTPIMVDQNWNPIVPQPSAVIVGITDKEIT